ncbi:aldo-keto reductase family 1 member B1-like [Oppia nitens]|uniref:aldo-keto reductase family 1 member B1-like n=1 Tax=Oppia nitens TaxID=1686743 RepID=UPI0023DA2D56|nr:aldo-keto reductase family 1 member B1-like [Oppia nitens]
MDNINNNHEKPFILPFNGQLAPKLRFTDGMRIPIIGLGTYDIRDQKLMDQVIEDAVDVGYRHIDTAYEYQNENLIGNTLKKLFNKNKIKRDDIFVTSKVWNTFHRRHKVIEGIKLSLNSLGLDYLDLALVHWPMAYKEGPENHPKHPNGSAINMDISVVETWRGMEDTYKLGLVKSIGVSNFNSEQLSRLLRETHIKPIVNQIECNPYLSQEKLVNFCKAQGIQVVAWSPIGRGNSQLLNEPLS